MHFTLRLPCALSACLVAAGCSGHIYHVADAAADPGSPVLGVPYYAPMSVIQETETTTLVDGKGIVTGNRGGAGGLIACQPVRTEQVVSTRNYARPERIWYEPGLLEANKFGVTLDASGALLAVNSESTPDQGNTLKNLAGAAASLAPIAAMNATVPRRAESDGAPATRLAACNNGSVVVGVRPYKIAQ